MKTLKQVAEKWLKEKIADGYTKEEAVDELMQYGCVSGTVSDLTYYSDTVKFFEDHKVEINELLKEIIEETGLSMGELFRDFDNDDPLCIDTHNQNLLAWFGFEISVDRLRD